MKMYFHVALTSFQESDEINEKYTWSLLITYEILPNSTKSEIFLCSLLISNTNLRWYFTFIALEKRGGY